MSIKLPFWATTLTLIGVITLISLGTWQLQRLAWKNDLIEQLNTAYESENSATLDLENINPDGFTYGRVSGTFLPHKAILLGPRTRNKEIGHDLLVPLKVSNRTLIINMGWTKYSLDELPIYHLKNKNVWFEGLVRTPKWNSFTPENVPAENLWYKADINEIAEVKDLKSPYPFVLRAENASHKFDAAFPNNERLMPNNNHMQYALFWFSLALSLIVIYVLRFIVKR